MAWKEGFSRLGLGTAALWLTTVLLAEGARAVVVTYDYQAAGDGVATSFQQCGTRTANTQESGGVRFSRSLGLTSDLGGDITAINPGESVKWEFNEAQTDVTLHFGTFTDSNLNGKTGEATIRGYDASGMLIGASTVDGMMTRDVSALFMNVPLSRVDLFPLDKVTVSAVDFNTNPGQLVGIRLNAFGSINQPDFTFCGVTITAFNADAASGVRVGTTTAMSVNANTTTRIDPGESIMVEFDMLASDVVYEVTGSFNLDFDQEAGEGRVTGFDDVGGVIGSVNVSGNGVKDVSAMFNDEDLSGFFVEATDDAFRILRVNHVPVPEPGTAGTGIAALLALGALARRARAISVSRHSPAPPHRF